MSALPPTSVTRLSPSEVEAWPPEPCPVRLNASFERVEAIWPAGLWVNVSVRSRGVPPAGLWVNVSVRSLAVPAKSWPPS